MLAAGGEAAIRAYAERTNLPAYTRNSITKVERLIAECAQTLEAGYALDNEEAEMDVGCIGVLLKDATGRVAGGLSVSAPIERRQMDWIEPLLEAGREISTQLGAAPTPRQGR
jgi:DNA-binding IclR family transcriptional regulator